MGSVAFIQDEAEFKNLVQDSPLLVVDCTASWCGPCKLVAPLMDQLAEDYGTRSLSSSLTLMPIKPWPRNWALEVFRR
jgi:thioredoxin 1